MFWAIVIALMAVPGTTAVELKPARCAVEIVIGKGEFENSASVQPVLVTHGPDVIYLPRWWPRGYRIERANAHSDLPPDAAPSVAEIPRCRVLEDAPDVYRFAEPSLLALSWRQVAEHITDTRFTVPKGTYRLSLTFALSDPRATQGSEIPLCTVYSRPFTVAHEIEWSSFD